MKQQTGLSDKTILFLGAGSMAEAIIRGLVHQQAETAKRITVTNRSNKERLEGLAQTYGVQTEQDPDRIRDLAAQSDLIVLAMKPADAPAALLAYRGLLTDKQLIVSVIAGLSIEVIRSLLGHDQLPVARTMPNTSSSIGLGMTGISFSEEMPETLKQLTMDMFQSVGETVLTNEDNLHTLTGISGSGPAYVYYFVEALVAGGIRGGLNAEDAKALAVSTLIGAAAMMKQTGEDPAELRRKVTSPNGTTQAAIEMLDRYSFKDAVEEAVLRCAERSREIAGTIDSNARNLLNP
ncbi:pyrroline-5-carboxylate reductase [Gorillibacterium timonense]|uniref:pyrroline-5-carboxylate reductase n=1 Tax=Gorillibacterium timonense TaxID=1689269 RepID=UPI00071C9E92|nr:pyrroline-5-carboxylate reductase [Gorillibacterium timonense]